MLTTTMLDTTDPAVLQRDIVDRLHPTYRLPTHLRFQLRPIANVLLLRFTNYRHPFQEDSSNQCLKFGVYFNYSFHADKYQSKLITTLQTFTQVF
jgi:hypothetical protein